MEPGVRTELETGGPSLFKKHVFLLFRWCFTLLACCCVVGQGAWHIRRPKKSHSVKCEPADPDGYLGLKPRILSFGEPISVIGICHTGMVLLSE